MARTGSKRNYQSLDLAEAKRSKVEPKDKKPVAAVAVGMVARASSDSGYHSDSSAAAAPADNDNAGERLFNKQTAKRPPPSSQLPLAARLQQRFGARDESLAVAYPEQCARGLYIYADGSNISVSFFNDLKKRMGMSRDQRLSTSAFSFHAFRGILERGREVKEGVIVGSRNNKAGSSRSSSSPSSVPLYLQEAEACDYTAKVLLRVPADNSSSSAGSFAMKEQGVDETVQHHMRKAVLDNLGAPGVMILATGDGNLDGDMEGGFPAAVQSALANGWVVEVYHFAESAHSTWRDPRFLHNPEWDGRLTCHALDDFVFDMDAKQQPATPLGAEVPRTAKRTRRESRPAYVPSWTLPPTQKAAPVPLPPAAAAAAAVTPPPSPPLEMAPATPEEIAELVGKLEPESIPVIAAALLRVASTTPPLAPAPAPAPARIPSASHGNANSFAGGAMGYFGAQVPSPPALAAFPQTYPLQYPQATSYTAALGQYQYNGVWGNQVGYYGHTG
ncbi:cell wall glucanase [Colletotrichum scovillei]|uniref:Cell wall glucanase n=2 Tax=Colletotrichum scovillei TaxID=1209932 RepID=A0A9P7R0X7_9PEZI|nr:cell wall glucanase [Colletotrichum scovillei]KAG7056655.1 cell wall glucanase [Colletotrichum scovillei]KAG7066579.1 cell wall glucanase [Colletotrichum scovillei]